MPKRLPKIKLKRAYEKPSAEDGERILVERLWPRGMTKQAAQIDHWAKDVAPSVELRKWYGHEPERWPEFQKRYREELDKNPRAVTGFRELIGTDTVTFVFAAADMERNSAQLLRAYLLG